MARRSPVERSPVASRVAALPTSRALLRIELKLVKPPVWRRVLVPESITLGKLHVIIQTAMGWGGGHLHEFEVGHQRYGMKDPQLDMGELIQDERRTRLATLIQRGVQRFTYLYDFGDGWEHVIKIEDLAPPASDGLAIQCIGGKNACPPDDVGGPYGYAEFLQAIADPDHEDHQPMREWIGGAFDPDAFDITTVNQILATFKS